MPINPDLSTGNRSQEPSAVRASKSESVKSKMRAMSDLGLNDRIEDIVITLDTQVHLIRPIGHADGDGLFVYVALDRSASNLVIARRDLHTIEDVLLA